MAKIQQQVVFKKDMGTAGMYKVVKLVGRTEPFIGEGYTALQIQDLIDRDHKVKVTIK